MGALTRAHPPRLLSTCPPARRRVQSRGSPAGAFPPTHGPARRERYCLQIPVRGPRESQRVRFTSQVKNNPWLRFPRGTNAPLLTPEKHPHGRRPQLYVSVQASPPLPPHLPQRLRLDLFTASTLLRSKSELARQKSRPRLARERL